MSGSNCFFLTLIQVSQVTSKVVWSSHLFKNFTQSLVIHTIKGFNIVNEAEVDFFPGTPLLSPSSNECLQFDLCFLFLFKTQFVHLQVHGLHTVKV